MLAEPDGAEPLDDEGDGVLDDAAPDPELCVEPEADGEYVPSSVPLDPEGPVDDDEPDDAGGVDEPDESTAEDDEDEAGEVDDPEEPAVEEGEDVDDPEDFGIRTGEDTGDTVSDIASSK